jgi:hypothetical protein
MSFNRFRLDDVGRELIERSSSLRIELHRHGEQVTASFRLSGYIGDPFGDEDEDTATVNDLHFVGQLIDQFQKHH